MMMMIMMCGNVMFMIIPTNETELRVRVHSVLLQLLLQPARNDNSYCTKAVLCFASLSYLQDLPAWDAG
jgi:hypothetical protein